MSAVKARNFDFSGVKDRSQYSPKHMAEGDYLAVVTSVEETKSKEKKEDMWVFGITLADHRSATYPYYVNIENADQLWKLRNLSIACGVPVGKKAMKIDPNKLVGKQLGVALADDEYDGKMKSVIDAMMPKSELADYAEVVDDDTEPDEDDFEEPAVEEEEEEEEAPAPKKKRKAKPAPVVEEDEDDEEEEEPEPAPVKKTRKAKAKPAPVEEDEDDDLELDLDDDE